MGLASLAICDISKSYQEQSGQIISVIKKAKCTFEQGVSYAIMGASGSGKSTLMHLMAGLELPDGGSVFFNNKNIHAFSQKDTSFFLQQSIGLLFQQPYLIKELSVLENVMLPVQLAGLQLAECKTRAQGLLVSMGLESKMYCAPSVLSGGQQLRVALARSVINRPTFLLADEPTGSLDGKIGKEIVDQLIVYQYEYPMGLIVCTHDEHVASRMDFKYELVDGKLNMI